MRCDICFYIQFILSRTCLHSFNHPSKHNIYIRLEGQKTRHDESIWGHMRARKRGGGEAPLKDTHAYWNKYFYLMQWWRMRESQAGNFQSSSPHFPGVKFSGICRLLSVYGHQTCSHEIAEVGLSQLSHWASAGIFQASEISPKKKTKKTLTLLPESHDSSRVTMSISSSGSSTAPE